VTTAAEKTSEPESLIDDAGELVTPDELTFEHAMQLQRNRALGAAFAHRCLTGLIWVSAALVLAVGVIGYLGWQVANPPVKYFSTEEGRVTKLIPTDRPGHSQSDVSAFGADTIRQSFTLDFVHYRDQMTQLGERYSEIGFEDYYKALATSNVLKAVKDQRMNLSVEVGPGVIRSRGKVGDNYAWEFQYPVTLKLDGQQSSSPSQRFIFTQRIQQTDVRVKSAGLEVTQVITTNAN
jgi:intracellular multiplication protein IcmL